MADYGSFTGNVVAQWSRRQGPDRNMVLTEDFYYTDPSSRVWSAPAGSVINGASIPQALWSTVGSPYIGDYRLASVVHDVACTQGANRKEADIMFYYACLAGGCSPDRARVFYLGVRIGAKYSSLILKSASSTFNDPFFTTDNNLVTALDADMLYILKNVGKIVHQLKDDTTPDQMDKYIDPYLV
ncbi:DUF1353 domain-containing protein [[Enterobacter] lignolyticus]|uniref:DUF1353 domain-containing protein n=1 Tax=Enterobacter lignolyticus (strain SCF1) TaxID=701347 RepID=E3G7D6_ENTLS|nr:DUF1353 domain-containing protein [[Enterobacter] lignolyticus]ADO48558.1 protein of unknown function DUF1353 [[Enterobacter] lignolyticus SCF1]